LRGDRGRGKRAGEKSDARGADHSGNVDR
jgi:hypothetical protein